MKVQAESFHLNGHIIGFRPRSQKLELPHKTLSNTLAVKGLITNIKFNLGSKDQGYKIEGPDLKRISSVKMSEPRKEARLILQSGIYIFFCYQYFGRHVLPSSGSYLQITRSS